MKKAVSVFWFRRDLRWQDNVGLYHALYQAKLEGHQVLPIFVFDKNILDQSEDKTDKRVDFIHQTLSRLQTELVEKGKSLWVQYGKPIEVFEKLFEEYF
jgi:deoxyribodipyrimidine photo-lyase